MDFVQRDLKVANRNIQSDISRHHVKRRMQSTDLMRTGLELIYFWTRIEPFPKGAAVVTADRPNGQIAVLFRCGLRKTVFPRCVRSQCGIDLSPINFCPGLGRHVRKPFLVMTLERVSRPLY